MQKHRWYWNTIPGETKGFWCLNCKLKRLERKNGDVEFHFEFKAIDVEKFDIEHCNKFKGY